MTTVNSSERRQLIASVADVVSAQVEPIVHVAVDGVSGAGKTTFADELAARLQSDARVIIRASVDDFHRPKAQRYRLGRDSPDGHYLESYDYEVLELELLDPLKPGGSRLYRTALFDCVLDSPIESEPLRADDGTILIVDGLFLNREELRRYWDVSIFLAVPFISRSTVARSATVRHAEPPTRRIGGTSSAKRAISTNACRESEPRS